MSIIERAIKHYGELHQVQKAQEELTELLDAINKYKDGRDTLDHIEEEVADVKIMICQLERIYGIELAVELWRKKKLERLEQRINAEV